MFGSASLPERFWDKVSVEPNTGCWLWTAGLQKDGYGKFKLSGATLLAHRVAYQALVGPIANDLQCDHLCRTRCCVNPAHIEPVTQLENMKRSPLHYHARTHCPQGHEYTPENTRSNRGNPEWRVCRICDRATTRRWKMRKAANENR